MKQIFVIRKEGKDRKTLYLRSKKYNGIHFSFSSYISHAHNFSSLKSAEDFLLSTNDLSGQLEIRRLWIKDAKQMKEEMDELKRSRRLALS